MNKEELTQRVRDLAKNIFENHFKEAIDLIKQAGLTLPKERVTLSDFQALYENIYWTDRVKFGSIVPSFYWMSGTEGAAMRETSGWESVLSLFGVAGQIASEFLFPDSDGDTPTQQDQIDALKAENERQRRTTNTILIVGGSLMVVLVGVAIWLAVRKKKGN